MIELKGEEYVAFVKSLDNEKLLYELVKQTVIFNNLAQQEMITDDDIFRYNMVFNEAYIRMEEQ